MKSYKIFLGFGLLAILIGFILTPSLSQLWEGFLRIQTHHLRLDTDMFTVAGSLGAPFMNASLVMLASLLIMFMTRTEIRGLEIGTLMLMFSFFFYSKSFFNMWPLVIGVFIEAKQARRIFSNIVFVALMASALGPFVSSVAFDIAFLGPGSPIAIGLAYLLGIVMGFVLAKVNAYFWTLHQGRILFNVGFTAGIIGVFTYNLFKVLNIEFISGPNTEYLLGINSKLLISFLVLIGYLFVIGLIMNGGFKTQLVTDLTDGGDYVVMYDLPQTLINVGVLGFVSMLLLILIPGSQLNGPVITGILTVSGFGAFGMTLKSITPIWISFIISCLVVGAISGLILNQPLLDSALLKLSSRGMLISLYHACGLAPTVKRDGLMAGMVVTALHMMNVTSTGALSGSMNSYNNGFSIGLVVILFIPMWRIFSRQRQLNPKDVGY